MASSLGRRAGGPYTTLPPDSLAASRWGRWHMSSGRLVSCHPSQETCLGLISSISLTQQALCSAGCSTRVLKSIRQARSAGPSSPPLSPHSEPPASAVLAPARLGHPREGLVREALRREGELLGLDPFLFSEVTLVRNQHPEKCIDIRLQIKFS